MTTNATSRRHHRTIPLGEAARTIFPSARDASGYDRLRRIIERHEATCPVAIIQVPRGASGGTARHVRVSDLPTLRTWAHDPRGKHDGLPTEGGDLHGA